MSNYFEAQVSYLKQNENGLIKAVKEIYLVDALSFTEVEGRINRECLYDNRKSFEVKAIKRSDVAELVLVGDTDQFFKVKITYTASDEDKGKKITLVLLVNASNIDEATERTRERLKEMLVPFDIPKVELSKIVEVLQHESNRPSIPLDQSNKEE